MPSGPWLLSILIRLRCSVTLSLSTTAALSNGKDFFKSKIFAKKIVLFKACEKFYHLIGQHIILKTVKADDTLAIRLIRAVSHRCHVLNALPSWPKVASCKLFLNFILVLFLCMSNSVLNFFIHSFLFLPCALKKVL